MVSERLQTCALLYQIGSRGASDNELLFVILSWFNRKAEIEECIHVDESSPKGLERGSLQASLQVRKESSERIYQLEANYKINI